MIDLYNFADFNNTQIFYAQVSGVWQTWQKPRGCKFVYFSAFGGGGGGGGGQSGSGIGRTGGGGGGSSVGGSVLMPATFVPDTLYIQVGLGGLGGSPNTNGTAGSPTYIGVIPSTTNVNLIISVLGGNPGQSNGTGGTNGAYNTGNCLMYSGMISLPSGFGANQIGGTAGGGTTGTSGTNIIAVHIVSGGAGGGGSSSVNVNGNGGSITIAGGLIFPNKNGGTAGGTNHGEDGIMLQLGKNSSNRLPIQGSGGAGGAGNGTGVGGNGGLAALGSGGGGGGAGVIGGSGGNGGDGFVIITCF